MQTALFRFRVIVFISYDLNYDNMNAFIKSLSMVYGFVLGNSYIYIYIYIYKHGENFNNTTWITQLKVSVWCAVLANHCTSG